MVSMYLALGAVAASGLQMSLTFPRRTRLVEDVPGLKWLFAVVGATVGVAAYWGNIRYGAMWAVAVSLSVGFVLLAMVRILWEALVSRSDVDHLDRRRARVAATGAAIVVLLGVANVADVGAPPDWASAVALVIGLFPIGYALIRHQYYSSEGWLRSAVGAAIGALLFLPAAVLLLEANYSVGTNEALGGTAGSFSLAALAFTTVLGSASLGRLIARTWVPDRLSALVVREEAVSDDLETARGQDQVCRKLAGAITDGLRASFVSIALVRQGKLEIVAASGERPVGPSGLQRVRLALDASSGLVHIGPEGGVSDWRWSLLATEGVAVATRIQWSSTMLGAVFVGSAIDGAAYSHEELSYVNRLCRCAGSALHHERLRSDLAAMERSATLHSVGAGLMHSVGKPLSIAARSADRLIARGNSDEDVLGLACIVRMAADEALNGIRTLREQADQPMAPGTRRIPVDEIIARSTGDAARFHGGRRVICRLGADLPAMPHGDEIRRLVTNLLDNALLATAPGRPSPEVRVRRQPPWLVIEVVDFGTGMDPATLERATDAFFTTRRGAGGSGIGLMDAKTTAERLHGDLRLCSAPRRGTRATVRVPLPDGAAPDERLSTGALAPRTSMGLQ
jgi:signal transduction histidine kinase